MNRDLKDFLACSLAAAIFIALCAIAVSHNPRMHVEPAPKGMHWAQCLEPDR